MVKDFLMSPPKKPQTIGTPSSRRTDKGLSALVIQMNPGRTLQNLADRVRGIAFGLNEGNAQS
jgi:hypothetical protein